MRGARPRVGILALQGDVEAHAAALERCDAVPVRVLRKEHLDGLAALILPGGESTTIARGLVRAQLVGPIRDFAAAGGALLGTCAGAILLAREARNHPVPTLGAIDVVAERNAYGTQVDSFATEPDAGGDPGLAGLRCVFIRAPRLLEPGPQVEVLLRVDGDPVLVRQGARLAATFHPELTADPRVHLRLLSLAEGSG